MANSHLDSVKSMYDERSESYDENEVHVKQAQDYIRWSDPQKGESVLDLACGTGLVALHAKRAVGESGHVVGVDISEGMLRMARRKADTDHLDVQFFNHDITNLDDIRDKVLVEGTQGFDVITCAAALILLPDPLKAVQHWKSLLRPGGSLITDVQTKDANLVMNAFSAIAPQLDETVAWHSELWQSQDALEKLMDDAGLKVQKIFVTESYSDKQFNAAEAGQTFDSVVDNSMYKNFGRADVHEKAKSLFIEHFEGIAGPRGSFKQETRYWIVVATRAE